MGDSIVLRIRLQRLWEEFWNNGFQLDPQLEMVNFHWEGTSQQGNRFCDCWEKGGKWEEVILGFFSSGFSESTCYFRKHKNWGAKSLEFWLRVQTGIHALSWAKRRKQLSNQTLIIKKAVRKLHTNSAHSDVKNNSIAFSFLASKAGTGSEFYKLRGQSLKNNYIAFGDWFNFFRLMKMFGFALSYHLHLKAMVFI